MTQHGVGQVPVVAGSEVVGIVTRTDLIKLWGAPHTSHPDGARSSKSWPCAARASAGLLQNASELAQEMGYALYVVGGFVRDLLLGEPNLDMDLVVEGDAIRLARRLGRSIGARTRSHKRFGTAKIILEEQVAAVWHPLPRLCHGADGVLLPLGGLPEVESSSIKADLHRRDFTINTLAIRLDSGHYGELLDFYGGEQDLKRAWSGRSTA
jgi:tRNA nucleotidyltransferase (CCA-adding enzyme)